MGGRPGRRRGRGTATLLAVLCAAGLAAAPELAASATFTASKQVTANTIVTRNSFGLTQISGTGGCTSEDGTSGTCVDGVGLREPAGVAVTADGTSVYAATYTTGGVAAFSRNTSTGVLTQLAGTNACITNASVTGCTTGKALSQSWGIAISPDDKFVYVAAYGSGAIAVFSRNTGTGVLTQLSGTSGCVSKTGTSGTCAVGTAIGGVDGVAISPDGNYLYAAGYSDAAVAVFSRNTSTGVLTQLSGTNACVSNSGSSGACVVGKGLTGVVALTVSPDGKSLYTMSDTDNAVGVFSRNIATGVITQLSGTAGCVSSTLNSSTCLQDATLVGGYDVVVSPDNANVYAIGATSSAVNVFTRNTTTSALTQLAGTAGCVSATGSSGACATAVGITGVQSVAVSPDGQDVYLGGKTDDAIAVFKRDPVTGALTQWAGTRACVSDSGTSGSCVTGRGIDGVHRVTVSADGKDVYSAGTGNTATGYVSAFNRSR